jgi:hypothetical protein
LGCAARRRQANEKSPDRINLKWHTDTEFRSIKPPRIGMAFNSITRTARDTAFSWLSRISRSPNRVLRERQARIRRSPDDRSRKSSPDGNRARSSIADRLRFVMTVKSMHYQVLLKARTAATAELIVEIGAKADLLAIAGRSRHARILRTRPAAMTINRLICSCLRDFRLASNKLRRVPTLFERD